MKKISIKDLLEQEDIFKGIRQSAIDTVEVLNKVQTELKDSAKVIQNDIKNSTTDSAKGLKEFSNAATAASKVMKDAALIAQQQAKAEQQKIKVDQELVKLEKLKAQEIARANKEAEKAAKLAAQETSAYAQLSKELNNARKAYKDLAVTNQSNTQEAKDLLNTINQLDAQLKEVDATVGQHQRNVGNYEGALQELNAKIDSGTMSYRELSKAIKQYQTIALQAGEDSAIGKDAIDKAAALKDRLGDLSNRTKLLSSDTVKLDTAMAAIGAGAGAFQAVEGAIALAGGASEDLQKALVKLQAVQMVANGVQQVANALNKDAILGIQLRNGIEKIKTLFISQNTAATAANTIAAGTNTTATVAQTTATNAANVATKGLNASMLLNPYVLVAAGVAALVYAFSKYLDSSDKAAKLEEKRNKEIQKQVELLGPLQNKMQDEIGSFRAMVGMLSQTNAGSKERSALISEINSKYGTTLKNLSDEKAFQDQLNNSVINFIALQKARYKVEASGEQLKVLFKEEILLEKQLETEKKLAEKEKERQQKTDDYMGSFDKQNKLNQGRVSNTQKLLEKNRAMQQQLSKESIDGYNKEKQAMEGLGMTGNNNVNTQQNYNKELEKTVDLTKEIQDEQTKQITDAEDRAKIQLQLEAQRRITEIKESTATAEQKAQLIKLVEENLATDIKKIYDDYYKDLRDKAIAQAEWIKKNKEDIAEQERQENMKLYNDSVTEEDKQNQAKLASLDGEQKKEFEERLAFQKDLDELNKLYFDGAFSSQEDYEKAVANLKKKYQADDIEKEKKAQEERLKTIEAFAQKTADYFKKKSEEKVKAIDEEISASEKQAETLKQLAADGNINAQQSLAEQQRIINEANLRKQKELRKQQRIEVGLAAFKAFSANADKDNPLASTIKDVTGLLAFINSLPMFYDGTEDTGTNGRGVDGKGGFHAILHPNERVLPKSLNQQIGNLSNEELARIAQDYQNGRLIGQDVAHSALDFAVMVNKIDELKEVIKNKPETNIALGEITQSAMQIVEQKRTGNTVIYNRYRVNR
jgi:hypothetical protein